MYLSYSLNFTTNKCSYFGKMALAGFQYEPLILDVKEDVISLIRYRMV